MAKKAMTKSKPKPKQDPKPKANAKTKAAKAKPETKSDDKKKLKPELKAKSTSAPKKQPAQKPAEKPNQKTAPAPEAQKKRTAPSEDENTRKARLRRLLIRKREDIIREAKSEIKKFKNGEKKQLVETVMDDGDMSVVDMAEDISLKQLSTHRENLMKIDIALRKLEEGTYGICEECGDEISEERLKIMPFAIYCRDDQERKEVLERLEREGQ